MLPELVVLAQYRLDNDWTFAQLSARMRTAGAFVSATQLRLHLDQRARPSRGPHERTLHKVRKFLATLPGASALIAAARRAAATSPRRRRARVAAASQEA